MATKGHARGGARTGMWQKMLAIFMAATLGLAACSPGNRVIEVEDEITPMSGIQTEQAEIEAAAEAGAEYTQTLEDGTVVSSDEMDVSDMDIQVVTVQEQAPEAEEVAAEAVDVETADGSSSGDMSSALSAAMGLNDAVAGGAEVMAAASTLGGLTINGGTVNTDFTHAANQVVIKTSTPLTLSGTFTGTVQVATGVEAWIILNGVTITGNNNSSPINLMASSKAHIILADGTTNTLHANQQGCAALHCGDGSSLWIDDAVVNYDFSANKHVDILYGKIGTAGTVKNMISGATTNVAVGDVFSKADTTGTMGKLIAKGGKGSAAIGAGPCEVSGNMTFDGGYIEAYSWGGHSNNSGNNNAAVGTGVTNAEGVNVSDSSGTGIGGGAGGGGATQTTFNGGIIYAFGSYHGAGIGAGWSSNSSITTRQTGAAAPTRNTNNCGNININGGYILSQGYAHGNAFGGACGTNMTNMTCRITGGTLRPFSHTSRADIGGSGGYVVIDGGSISLSGTQAAKFMSSNNKAYSDVARTQEVVPVEVDLSAQTGTTDFNITDWTLLIDGKIWQYGAPSKFNAGKLTLWLPPTAKTQKVEVQLNYYDPNKGSEVLVEPLYREAGSTSSTVKRNVYFDMPYHDVFGDAQLTEESLPTITNFPNELLVDGKVPATVKTLEKEYDGLPFKTATISDLSIVESISKETRKLTNNELVTYSYRLLNGNTFTDELTAAQMPSDTGLMAFAMNSTEYAQGEWGKSYIGHRSNGWVRITPVPAVLTMEGAEWGNLNEETGEWKVTTSKDDEPGNRIKVKFNIRSAEGTAVTCKVPTGQVQLSIDGKKFGAPITLTKEAIEADGFSKYTVTEGPTDESANTSQAIASRENRWTAHVEYYMDPANADGLLNPKSTFKAVSKSDIQDNATPMADSPEGDDGNKYNLTAEYLPDKNYVEGLELNPKNADAKATIIIPVDAPVAVTDDQGGKYVLKDEPTDGTPTPRTGAPTGGKAADVTGGGKTYEYDAISKNYSDFHKLDAEGNETIEKDYFVLQLESKSDMPMTWVSSDPAVADVMRDDAGNVVYDENGNPKVVVYSCGDVQLVMHQPGNAVFNEQTYKYNYRVVPDPSIKPDTEARVIWNNLTHPGMPAAPGDEIEYTIVGSNLTDGSAWQDVNLGDIVPSNVTINPDTVQVAKNFGTPEDREGMSAADLADLDFEPVTDAKVTTGKDGSQIVADVGTVYGGQSTALKFTVTVNPNIVDRETMTGENPPTIPNTPTASGSYGVKEEKDLVNGETIDESKRVDVTDTVIIGIEVDDELRAGVLPKDVVLGGPDGQIKVEKTAANLTAQEQGRTAAVTLPGDKVTYSVTVTNTEPDSCLHWPVIRDTLPQGVELVPGTLKLTRVDGKVVDVDDKVYVKQTNTIALYVDDLYGGESTTLTFECTVGDNASTVDNVAKVMGTEPSDKWKGDHPDNPDLPIVPDGPKAEELLGGTLVTPEPNPDDPEAGDPAEGVTVGPIPDPNGPLATATKADPTDPTKPAEPTDEDPDVSEPILPGDVIVKFGDKVPPTSPDDIAKEMDRIIKETLAEDPEATEVDIPVTVKRVVDPETGATEEINVIVTVPIPQTPEPEPLDPTVKEPGQPWTPDPKIPTEQYPWDDFNWEEFDEGNGTPDVKNEVPATPGTLIPSRDPVVDGNPADIKVEKTAENLTRGNDGDTYVGDRVRYTVTVSNSKPGTTWFNCVVRDDLPKGVDIDMATAKVITSAGQEVAVEQGAYNEMNRILAVKVGHVPGGLAAKLVFEATISEAAASNDVGNTAHAYGTVPSKVNPDDLADGKNQPGSAFDPMKETGMSWPDYDKANPPLSNGEPAYPSKHAKDNGVRPADEDPQKASQPPTGGVEGEGGAGDGDSDGDGWGTNVAQRFLQLAQTGDPLVLGIAGLALVAVAAAIALVATAVRRRRDADEDKTL